MRQLSGYECSTSAQETSSRVRMRPTIPPELKGSRRVAYRSPRGALRVEARLLPSRNLQRQLLNQLALRQSQAREKKEAEGRKPARQGSTPDERPSADGIGARKGSATTVRSETAIAPRDPAALGSSATAEGGAQGVARDEAAAAAAAAQQLFLEDPVAITQREIAEAVGEPAPVLWAESPLAPPPAPEFPRPGLAGLWQRFSRSGFVDPGTVTDVAPAQQRAPEEQRASMGSPTADEAPTLDRGAANEMRGPAPGIAPPPAVPVAVTIEAPPAPPSPDKPASAKPAAVPLPVPPLTAPSGRPQWRPGSVEDFLEREGVPAPLIEDCVRRIVAWRVTKLGRVLVDRRRRNRVERNMVEAAEYLERACGVPRGPHGVGRLLSDTPMVLLCKASLNDRWDRRALELAAYKHHHGHCNVPEDWPGNPELSSWLRRQYVAVAQGTLSPERTAVLDDIGVSFEVVQQITTDWEAHFDLLLDLRSAFSDRHAPFPWDTAPWMLVPDPALWDLAHWLELQRAMRTRGLATADAVGRLTATQAEWAPQRAEGAGGWMATYVELVYHHYRHEQALLSREALQQAKGPKGYGSSRTDGTAGQLADVVRVPGTFVEWLPRAKGTAGVLLAGSGGGGAGRGGEGHRPRTQVDAPVRAVGVMQALAADTPAQEERGWEGAEVMDMNPTRAFWKRLQDGYRTSGAASTPSAPASKGSVLLTADICAAWVDCLTAAMDDAAPLRAPGTQQGALEPIAKFRATDGHAQVRAPGVPHARLASALALCRDVCAARTPPVAADTLMADGSGARAAFPAFRLPPDLHAWLLRQLVRQTNGRLAPWQSVALASLGVTSDTVGLAFEVMARALAAQVGNVPITHEAALRLLAFSRPDFLSPPPASGPASGPAPLPSSGTWGCVTAVDTGDGVWHEVGVGAMPKPRKRGRRRKDEVAREERADAGSRDAAVTGIAGMRQVVGSTSSYARVPLPSPSPVLTVAADEAWGVEGAPAMQGSVLARAEAWRVVPGARDRAHAARMIKRWMRCVQFDASHGLLTPKQRQLLLALGIWGLFTPSATTHASPRPSPTVAANHTTSAVTMHAGATAPRARNPSRPRGLTEGQAQALQRRVGEALLRSSERYSPWDVRLAGLVQALVDAGARGVAGDEVRLSADLSAWLEEQRAAAAAGSLGPRRAAQLEALGVDLKPRSGAKAAGAGVGQGALAGMHDGVGA